MSITPNKNKVFDSGVTKGETLRQPSVCRAFVNQSASLGIHPIRYPKKL